MKTHQGFTMIELLMVLVILSIITAFAVPSYQEYARKKDRAVAQQEMQKLAAELERHRGKNFSYARFSPSVDPSTSVYNIVVTDGAGVDFSESGASGFAWRIYAERKDPAKQALNYDLLMTSTGLRCMTQTKDTVKNGTCGDNGDNW